MTPEKQELDSAARETEIALASIKTMSQQTAEGRLLEALLDGAIIRLETAQGRLAKALNGLSKVADRREDLKTYPK
jgi:hypothetical protein